MIKASKFGIGPRILISWTQLLKESNDEVGLNLFPFDVKSLRLENSKKVLCLWFVQSLAWSLVSGSIFLKKKKKKKKLNPFCSCLVIFLVAFQFLYHDFSFFSWMQITCTCILVFYFYFYFLPSFYYYFFL